MSSRNLADLHYLLRPLAEEFLDRCHRLGLDILITCTYRSPQEQDRLYALGRTVKSHVGPWDDKHPLGHVVTRAKGGESEHNYMMADTPAALAFDIVPLLAGKPVWNEDSLLWQQAGNVAIAVGLNWYGVPGAPFKEFPHMALRESKIIMTGASSGTHK